MTLIEDRAALAAHPPPQPAPASAPRPGPTDAAAILRSRYEPQAFAAIFDRHWPALHAFCAAQLENRLWGNAMDALNAGAARPAVRAGVLHLLATVDSVTVAKAEDGGRDVLVLTAALPGEDAYAERLTIDAATGMPLRFTGGEPGRAPSVTVTYDVSRVSVADVAKR